MGDRAFYAIIILLLVMTGGYFYLTKNHSATKNSAPGMIVTNADVEGFVRHDFAKVLTIDSRQTAEERLQQAQPYMTASGMKDLDQKFLKSDWMKSTERTDVSFVTDPKVSEKRGDAWIVKCRIGIDFTGGGSKRSNDFIATLHIVERDLNGERTFGVDAMKLVPAKR